MFSVLVIRLRSLRLLRVSGIVMRFFFQAEDSIRDGHVTGVQTCALPIYGLKVLWRAPVNAGYSGPAVAGGRVFVTDFVPIAGPRGTERMLCFDEKTGKLLWKQEWEASYGPFAFTNGPHATPTVDGDRVYALGTAGTLVAMNAG